MRYKQIGQGLLWVVLMLGLAACDGLSGGGGGAVFIPPTTVTLTYNAESLIIQNMGENVMADPARLAFVRGAPNADGDDYRANRMTTGALQVGACYTLTRRGSTPLRLDACPETVNSDEQMTNITGLFWRAEPVQATAFDVLWDGELVAQCETFTIADTAAKQCSFVYPPAPEETN
jgi:hypothetical protein